MQTNIYNKISEINDALEELRNEYVPDKGQASTTGGEILRAVDRLIYRFYNDGDMVGKEYGNQTCNSSFRYLQAKIKDLCPVLFAAAENSEAAYERLLLVLISNVKDLFDKKPNLFEIPNHVNSRTEFSRPEDFTYDDYEDEEEDYEEEDEDDYYE